MKTRLPQAFSLAELLVVIAIITAMVGMLLPAVQRVRESANKLKCMSNLRQMGIAMNTYHATHGSFPPSVINPGYLPGAASYPPPPIAPKRSFYYPRETAYRAYNHTGFTLLLPYIEQSALYAKYDFTRACAPALNPSCMPEYQLGVDVLPGPGGYGYATGFVSPNLAVVSQRIPIYECPSDQEPTVHTYSLYWDWLVPGGNPMFQMSAHDHNEARRSNYLLSVAALHSMPTLGGTIDGQEYKMTALSGVFGYNGAARLDDILDGACSTILIGESKQIHIDQHVDGSGVYYVGMQGPFWGAGCTGSVHGIIDPIAPQFRMNYHFGAQVGYTGKNALLQFQNAFGSWHRGGANFVFCDGSVHFISDRVSYSLLYALATIRGSDTPDPTSY